MNHQGPQIPEDVNDSNLYRAYRLLLSVCETGVLSRACDSLKVVERPHETLLGVGLLN